jgi:hypothetical protein
LQVSRVALGTWAIGGWMWGGTDEAESIKTIQSAIEHGITVIDTAPAYGFGRSEEIVGQALSEARLRSQVVISTKVGLEWEAERVFRNSSRARILREVKDSLRRLRTDYIDVYQVHWPDTPGDHRGNRRDHAGAVRAGHHPRHRRQQFFRATDGSIPADCACTYCSRRSICSSATLRPTSCRIVARTTLRPSVMGRCAAACCRGGCAPTRIIPYLATALLLFLIVVFAYALAEHLVVMTRWLDRPSLFVFPVAGALAAIALAASVHGREDALPFPMVAVIFVAAFGTLAISFWPYMIPFSITIDQAAAPRTSLAFMFWEEGLFVLPLMLLYTGVSLTVFKGKTTASSAGDHY